MYSSNLLEIFKTLSSKEMKEFEEFVESPYYNKNKNVISLFGLIKAEYPEFNKGNLIKEKIFSKIYPLTDYNDGTIRLLMFYLQETAEKFLAVKNYEEDLYAPHIHRLSELNNRRLHKIFDKDHKTAIKTLSEIKVRNYDYYHGKFLIGYENLSHIFAMNFDRDEKFVGKMNAANIFQDLTNSYLIRIFKYYLLHLNIRTKFNVEHEFKVFDELILRHKPEDFEDIPVINLFYYCLMMIIKPDEEEFFYKAKKLLFENEDSLFRDDKAEFYINLENYCKRRFKIGLDNFKNEIFEIYTAELKKKAYIMNGYMPELFYKSVADIGLQLKKFEWTKNFLETYKEELQEQFRENTYLHLMGLYEFSIDNFEKALEIISKVKFDEIYQKLDLKCLLNAIYYELKIDSSLESGIDTFRHFLKNDKIIAEERKLTFSIFNKNIAKLLKLRNKPDLEESELFLDNIRSGNYYNKEWVVEKATQLIDNFPNNKSSVKSKNNLQK
ncbi:hypothetical protein BH10BAC5_BH10BAC5_10280 [soil metagenome]